MQALEVQCVNPVRYGRKGTATQQVTGGGRLGTGVRGRIRGSSGSMEGAITKDIFARSVTKHKLRYTRFIGDGDTNTYKTVVDSKPYGNFMIHKNKQNNNKKCVGHVQKRMGTRLRNLKKRMKGQQLSDGNKKQTKKVWKAGVD